MSKKEKSQFAKNLEYLRKNAKKTQAFMGSVIEKSREVYHTYESGRNEPSIKNLVRFASHWKVSVDDLLKKDLSKA